jgi:hypothetical protein
MKLGSRISCAVAAALFVCCKSGGGGEATGADGGAGTDDGGTSADGSKPGSGSGSSDGGGGGTDAGSKGSDSGADAAVDPYAWAANTKPASKGSLINAIAADSTGVVIAGQLIGSTVVNGTTYKGSYVAKAGAPAGGNAMLIKYNTSGVPQWAVIDTGTVAGGASVFQSVAIDPSTGDILVGAYFLESLTVDGTTVTLPTAQLGGQSPNLGGTAILRFKSTGASLVWSETMATTDTISVSSLAVDSAGDVVAAGWNQGLASFSTSTGTAVQLNSPVASNGGLYLARYSGSGDLQWAVTPPSTPSGAAIPGSLGSPPTPIPALAVDATNDIYLAVGSENLGSSGPLLTGGHVLLNKYTSAGALSWTEQATGTGGAYFRVTGLAVDPGGNPIVCGSLGSFQDAGVQTSLATFGTFQVTEAGFVAKYSPTGTAQWATGISDGSANNSVFCAANATHVLAFAPTSLSGPNADVLHLDPSTGTAATTPAAVATGQQIYPQAVVTSGTNVYIAGQVQYPATFGTTNFAGDGKSTVPFVASLAAP